MAKEWTVLNQALGSSLLCLKGIEAWTRRYGDGIPNGGEMHGNYAHVVDCIAWLEKAIAEHDALAAPKLKGDDSITVQAAAVAAVKEKFKPKE